MVSDRERGFLSKRDRKYLLGETDIESKSARERNVRRSIRERTRSAFIDFTLMMDELEDKDREQIFDGDDMADEFDEGLADTIAFLFAGITNDLSESNMPVYPDSEFEGQGNYQSMEFLPLLYEGLYRGYMEFDILLDGIVLKTTATRLPKMETNLRRLEAGETLPPKYLALLIKSEQISAERVTELARDELLDDTEREIQDTHKEETNGK